MTKNQKIWLAVSLALFVIPELLWSPVSDLYYQLFQSGDTHSYRQNFLTDSDNVGILKVILVAQLLSLLISFVILMISRISNRIIKRLVATILLILILLTGFITLFALNSNPQIG